MDMIYKAMSPNHHRNAFLADVINGLSHRRKNLPCRWLYDNAGSELFEAITQLPEYYPTRTESAILLDNASAIADFAGSGATLLEYGAGAGIKTETLIAALCTPRQYIPIDIAAEFLEQTVVRIRERFPKLQVDPMVSDFMIDFELPAALPEGRRVAFFPGSTIGNLDVAEAGAFLQRMRRHVGKDGVAIIGFDLKKDTETMLAAYDDAQEVTARFNLNLLTRINRELGGDFAVSGFRHAVRWNSVESAVEMHLVSQVAQTVTVNDFSYDFEAGETIHTESSRKYSLEDFSALAIANGWQVEQAWTDRQQLFNVVGLRAN
ncbi:MAG TPA: L-histidine N(alpha)-methyltransferase [Herbaspirillum sp.]|jgi:dimethylhistidine N-methyltransferase